MKMSWKVRRRPEKSQPTSKTRREARTKKRKTKSKKKKKYLKCVYERKGATFFSHVNKIVNVIYCSEPDCRHRRRYHRRDNVYKVIVNGYGYWVRYKITSDRIFRRHGKVPTSSHFVFLLVFFLYARLADKSLGINQKSAHGRPSHPNNNSNDKMKRESHTHNDWMRI